MGLEEMLLVFPVVMVLGPRTFVKTHQKVRSGSVNFIVHTPDLNKHDWPESSLQPSGEGIREVLPGTETHEIVVVILGKTCWKQPMGARYCGDVNPKVFFPFKK